jgi:hypothetical protein
MQAWGNHCMGVVVTTCAAAGGGMSAAPKGTEAVEMLDGRVYYSQDGWATVWLIDRDGTARRLKGKAADLGRFLAITQASAARG